MCINILIWKDTQTYTYSDMHTSPVLRFLPSSCVRFKSRRALPRGDLTVILLSLRIVFFLFVANPCSNQCVCTCGSSPQMLQFLTAQTKICNLVNGALFLQQRNNKNNLLYSSPPLLYQFVFVYAIFSKRGFWTFAKLYDEKSDPRKKIMINVSSKLPKISVL